MLKRYSQDYKRRALIEYQRLNIYGPIEAAVDDQLESSPLRTLARKLTLRVRGIISIISCIWSSVPAIDIEDRDLYRSARCMLSVADSATGSMESHSLSVDIEPVARSGVSDSEMVEDSRKHVGR